MPFKTKSIDTLPGRPVWRALRRGGVQKCPSCGQAGLFAEFLKVHDACASCGEELHHHRADDAPPYFTIFLVGHLVLPPVMWLETLVRPAIWVHMAVWLPLALALTLLLLPAVKGAIVGLQWAHRMHGFDQTSDQHERPVEP